MQHRNLRRALVGLLPALTLVGCSVENETSDDADVASSRQALGGGGAWQQSGYGPSKARVNAWETTLDATNVSGLSQAWSAPTSSYTTAAVVANGYAFVGSRNGMVNAYDVATGAVSWTTRLPGSVNASPAVAYGRVYVTSNDRRLYALNASTGEIVFDALHPGQVSHVSPLVAEGKVFVRCESNGVVYAYDAKAKGTAAPLFTLEPEGGASTEPSYAYGSLYVPAFDGRVHAYVAASCTGKCTESWATPSLGGVMYFSPALASGRLYGVVFGETEVTVQAMDAYDGTPFWSKVLTGSSAGVGPAVAYGKVFVSLADTRELWALNTGSGALVWKAPLADEPTDLPAVANRVVYVPSGRESGHVEAFDASCGSGGATCTALYSASVAAWVTSPVIADGRVIVGAGKSTYAFALP